MNGPTNAGGGGTKANGFIEAIYPEGSICTCSNGAKTLKARDTSGYMMFVLPAIGEWTVTSTDPADPTNTASTTAQISKEGECVSVTLDYGLYIIKNGVIQPGFAFEKYDSRDDSLAITENEAGYAEISINGYYNGANTGAVYLPDVMPLVKYSKLSMEYMSTSPGYASKLDEYSNCVGLLSKIPTSGNISAGSYAGSVTCPNATRETVDLELTSYRDGDYYIAIGIYSRAAGSGASYGNTMQVYNLWLK